MWPKYQKNDQMILEEHYPEYGDTFICLCHHWEEDTAHTLVLTKKFASQLIEQETER